MNISDLMVGLYLISIASADVTVGDNYVELDLSWGGKFAMPYIKFHVHDCYTHINFFHVGS